MVQLEIVIKLSLRGCNICVSQADSYAVSTINDKNHWLVDSEAAMIVKRIFRMSIDGMGPWSIAEQLPDEKNCTAGGCKLSVCDGISQVGGKKNKKVFRKQLKTP